MKTKYTVSYRNMKSDHSKEVKFTSKSAAMKWAREFVALSYRNEAAAIVSGPDDPAICRYDNINGRAVKGA